MADEDEVDEQVKRQRLYSASDVAEAAPEADASTVVVDEDSGDAIRSADEPYFDQLLPSGEDQLSRDALLASGEAARAVEACTGGGGCTGSGGRE